MATFWPVLLLSLSETDRFFIKGKRYCIVQQDGQQHYFTLLEGDGGAREFMRVHAMQNVSVQQMREIRRVDALANGRRPDFSDLIDLNLLNAEDERP